MPQYQGECHCGQVAWTAEIPEESHVLCHCGACKILGGGEFTLNQIIPKSNFNLTKGDLKVYTYKGDSGNNTDCYMCPNCAASPYHHQHVMGKYYCTDLSFTVPFPFPFVGGLFFHDSVPAANHPTNSSPLFFFSSGETTIVIRTGLLKGSEKWGKPAAEIYDKDRAAWLPQTASASFNTTPPS